MKMWKLPAGVNIEIMKGLKGLYGNFLNPIQDANGNWVVSDEEYSCPEFQFLKQRYPDIFEAMERITYEPAAE